MGETGAGTGVRTRRRLRCLLFAGTRPEAIKLAPLVLAGRAWPEVQFVFVHAGQHSSLFEDGFHPFGLRADYTLDLGARKASPEDMVDAIVRLLVPLLADLGLDMVVVQGDTSSALAGAIAAHALRIPVAHVEAGLRSGDPYLPWPEEGNRRAIARLADLHFAPSERAAANLMNEAVAGHIHVVGNPGIDALRRIRRSITPQLHAHGRREILVTAHRREVMGAPLDRIAAALKTIVAWSPDRHITVLLHENPVGQQFRAALGGVPDITLAAAVRYPEMVSMLAGADLVLSDSGGLQEECPALGLPLIVLRDLTERPEVIEGGSALLVGTGTREIVEAANLLLDDATARLAMCEPRYPYGEGDAAERILGILAASPIPRA